MTISEVSVIGVQSLFLAETVALIVARRRIDPEMRKQLGRTWHQRLESLTYMVRRQLVPALLMVVTFIATALLGTVAA